MKEKQVKKKGMAGKIIRTVLSLLLVIVMVILMVAANTALRSNDRMVNSILGDVGKTIDRQKGWIWNITNPITQPKRSLLPKMT